jgi:hypothetical protein
MSTVTTCIMTSSCLWLLWDGHIPTKTDAKIASELRFRRSIYAYKVKEITFTMKLITCQNSYRINRNDQNNIPIVATGIVDVIMLVATVVGCCAFADLVPPRSPKLRLTYLKTEACWVVLNIDSRPRARVWVAAEACWGGSVHDQTVAEMVIGEAVRACRRRCSVVQWPELKVEVEVDCSGQS